MYLKQGRTMDLLQYLLSSTLIFLISVKELNATITVTTPTTVEGLLGNNEVELTCTYSLAETDKLFIVTWLRQKRNPDIDSYEQMAQFFPPSEDANGGASQGDSTLQNLTDPTVFGRVLRTNPTVATRTAVMKFTSVVCGDERKYKCSVQGLNGGTQNTIVHSVTNLTVKASPDTIQFKEVVMSPNTSIEEDRPVQFTCMTNVGRPAGTFSWRKFRKNDPVGVVIAANTIHSSSSPVCTFSGTSSISIVMNKEDDKLVVRCTINQVTLATGPYQQTDEIPVFYKPTNLTTTINKDPSPSNDVHYEDDNLSLTCVAEGNPTPTYVWLLNGTQISTGLQYQLTGITTDQSGEYTCVATNNYNGNTYSSYEAVTINIEKASTTTTPPTSTVPTTENSGGGGTRQPQGGATSSAIGTTEIIIIVVVLVIVAIIAAIVFICVCRKKGNLCKGKTIEEPPEKPRNNQDMSFANNPQDVTHSNMKSSNNLGYNNFDKGKELQYADLTFDDKPRSRRPIQILDTDLGPPSSAYSEVTMPRV